MTRVAVDSTAILKKSAGEPRFTPSIQLPLPRSSSRWASRSPVSPSPLSQLGWDGTWAEGTPQRGGS